MSLFPTISELHQRRLHYLTRQCQTFITSYQSVIYTAPAIQLSETKSVTILYIKTTYSIMLNQLIVILQFEAYSLVKSDWWHFIMLQELYTLQWSLHCDLVCLYGGTNPSPLRPVEPLTNSLTVCPHYESTLVININDSINKWWPLIQISHYACK